MMKKILLYLPFVLVALNVQAEIFKYTDILGRTTFSNRSLNTQGLNLEWRTSKYGDEPVAITNVSKFRQNRQLYSPLIEQIARKWSLHPSLLHAVVRAESAYNPEAVSRVGAVGLMQLMPSTAKRYGVNDRYNPIQSLEGGAQYLKTLLKLFDNDLDLVLAGYNAGEGTVKKYGYKIPPYPETQKYVKKVRLFIEQYKSSGLIDS